MFIFVLERKNVMIIDTYCIHSSVCRVCLFFCVHTVQGGWAQVYLLLSVPFTLCLDSKMPLFLPGSKKKTKSSFGGKRVLCATSPHMGETYTPSPLLMQLGIGPISPTTLDNFFRLFNMTQSRFVSW